MKECIYPHGSPPSVRPPTSTRLRATGSHWETSNPHLPLSLFFKHTSIVSPSKPSSLFTSDLFLSFRPVLHVYFCGMGLIKINYVILAQLTKGPITWLKFKSHAVIKVIGLYSFLTKFKCFSFAALSNISQHIKENCTIMTDRQLQYLCHCGCHSPGMLYIRWLVKHSCKTQ